MADRCSVSVGSCLSAACCWDTRTRRTIGRVTDCNLGLLPGHLAFLRIDLPANRLGLELAGPNHPAGWYGLSAWVGCAGHGCAQALTLDKGSFSNYRYVRRRGRTTAAQARALDEDLDAYLMTIDNYIGQPAQRRGIEIGFGMGDGLLCWAKEAPDWHLLGIDLYLPGIGSLVNKLKDSAVDNVGIIPTPAQEVMQNCPDNRIDEIRVLFPDPWPKKRHAKRRLIQPAFIEDCCRVLKTGGVIRLATDWQAYADWMREVLGAADSLHPVLDEIRKSDAASTREVATKFEQRGQQLGHAIHDLVYQRGMNSPTTLSR